MLGVNGTWCSWSLVRFPYSLVKQLVGCDWYIAWCEFRVRRLEEVDIKIPGQELSSEHEVLVLDLSVSF